MKKLEVVGGLLLALALLPRCNTEQPLKTGTQTASLDFASYTTGELVDVWDRYRDRNNDDIAQKEEFVGTECGDTYPAPSGSHKEVIPHAALWGFSAQVQIIPAGTTTPIDLLPPSAATGFTNFPTAPDDTTQYPADPPIPDQPPGFDPAFLYLKPRRMLNVSSDVMRCTSAERPVTNLGGFPLPFFFTLEPGDTVIVTAGRNPRPPFPAWSNNPKSFDAVLRVNGIVVIPQGTTTTNAVGGTISFSYQSR